MDPSDDAERRKDDVKRLQILEALVSATARRAEVLQVIGDAANAPEAVAAVRELLGVSQVAAEAVVDLQLRRFTEKERERLTATLDEFRASLNQP